MEIEGKVTTGLGKGAYFISQEFYCKKIFNSCGFVPFPGTLNIIVPNSYLNEINKLKESCTNVIQADEGFGGLKYIKAILNNQVTGAIVFPEKTIHEVNYLEFIAKKNLRKELNLKDEDKVILKF